MTIRKPAGPPRCLADGLQRHRRKVGIRSTMYALWDLQAALRALNAGDTLIIWADLGGSDGASCQPQSGLSDEEQVRAARMASPCATVRYRNGRCILRQVLGGLSGVQPSAVRFAYGPVGKPALSAGAGASVQFNLSHAGDHAVHAVAVAGDVGIDLERLDRSRGFSMLYWTLAPDEFDLLAALPEPDRREMTLRFWARKEAVLKASGLGLSVPLDDVPVRHIDRPITMPRLPGRRWRVLDLSLPHDGYVAALAVEWNPDPVALSYWRWPGIGEGAPGGNGVVA